MADDPEAGSRGPEAGHHEAVQAEAAAQGGGGGGGTRDHDRHRVCGSTFTVGIAQAQVVQCHSVRLSSVRGL